MAAQAINDQEAVAAFQGENKNQTKKLTQKAQGAQDAQTFLEGSA
jgi:hypothetical protein